MEPASEMKAETHPVKTGTPRGLSEVLLRRSKIAVFQAQRLLDWAFHPSRWKKPGLAGPEIGFPYVIYEKVIPIARQAADTHPLLEEGKRMNLALAAPSFDGLLLEPHRPFSFWRSLGQVSEKKGYRFGMEIREGCVVPAIGGGLCLLSNALFQMACELGWAILERHGHTMEVSSPEPNQPWGLDATLFWPHVDLRFAPRRGKMKLEVRVIKDSLHLKVRASEPLSTRTQFAHENQGTEQGEEGLIRRDRIVRKIVHAPSGEVLREEVVAENYKRVIQAHETRENCITCGETDCEDRPQAFKKIP
jgi:vancomycin resistance protein VanW